MTDPAPHQAAIDVLAAERDQLLQQAAANRTQRHPEQAKTCDRLAGGCGYAIGVLKAAGP